MKEIKPFVKLTADGLETRYTVAIDAVRKREAFSYQDARARVDRDWPELIAEHENLTHAAQTGDPRYCTMPEERAALAEYMRALERAEQFAANAPVEQAADDDLTKFARGLIQEEFGGDMARWSEAYERAYTLRPDLVEQWLGRPVKREEG